MIVIICIIIVVCILATTLGGVYVRIGYRDEDYDMCRMGSILIFMPLIVIIALSLSDGAYNEIKYSPKRIVFYKESGEAAAVYDDTTNVQTEDKRVSFIDNEGRKRTIGYSTGWVEIEVTQK